MNIVKHLIYLVSVIILLNVAPASAASDKAEHFSINTLDGEEFRLQDYVGKKAVHLVFWATWCPNCRREIPKLKEIHKKYVDDMQLLSINVAMNDPLPNVKQYVEKHDINYAVAYDKGSEITRRFGVEGTPTQLIIDINGNIRYRGVHVPEDIDQHLPDLLTISE